MYTDVPSSCFYEKRTNLLFYYLNELCDHAVLLMVPACPEWLDGVWLESARRTDGQVFKVQDLWGYRRCRPLAAAAATSLRTLSPGNRVYPVHLQHCCAWPAVDCTATTMIDPGLWIQRHQWPCFPTFRRRSAERFQSAAGRLSERALHGCRGLWSYCVRRYDDRIV